jgi:subtilisin family serine protease
MRTSRNRALTLCASAALATGLSVGGSVAAAAPGPSTTTTTTTPPATTPTTTPPAGPSTVRAARQPVPNQYVVTLKGVAPGSVPTEAGRLAGRHGGAVFAVYQRAVQGFAVRMNRAQADALAREPNVAVVQEDGVVHATTTEAPSPSWGLDRVDQHQRPLDNAYTYGGAGAGVHAYIIDTGIRTTHQDFGGRASFGVDEILDGQPPGTDCYGHGTHVSGTLGGTAYGVAKQVSLVEVRVLDCSGSGFDSQVISGIDWVTAHAIQPAVANMSLGGGPDSSLDNAVKGSIAAGITYAVAAGNSNGANACGASPSDTGGTNGPALTAAASDINDHQAAFSNVGTCVDLYGPGVGITSDWNSSDTATNVLSGTSMATPHVAGTAALYLGAHPSSTPATVKFTLAADATPNVITNATGGTPNRLDYTGPGAPTLTATSGAMSVQLSWTVPADGGSPITNYKVYRGTSSGAEAYLTTVSGSTTSYIDSSFTCGGTYFYQVSAVTVVDETRSAEQQASPNVTPTAPCAPPLTATAASHVVHLSWVPSANGGSPITNYKIYRGASPGGESLLTTVSPSTTTYDDTGLTNGTPNYYQVAAVNIIGETRSTEHSATPVVAVWEFALGVDHGVWDQQFTSGAWSGWQPLGGYLNSNVATTTTSTGVSIFSAGGNSALYYQQYNGAWSGWLSLGGGINSNPTAVTDASGTWVFARAPGDGIWYQHLTGGTWSGWQTLGGRTIGNPAAIADTTGIWIFARGLDGAPWYQHFTGGAWSGWQTLGGQIISDPALATGPSGTFMLGLGGDHSLWDQQFTSGSWSGWQPRGGYISSALAATGSSSGAFVFGLGSDASLYYQQFTGSWSGWQPLGGAISSNPATVADSSGIWAVARGPGNAPWYRRFSGGSWTPWQTLGSQVISDSALAFG